MDTLMDVVWSGQPPATARTQVAICIAALRKVFKSAGASEDLIVTAHPGYLLNAEGHSVDAADFETLVNAAEEAVREGRPEEAARCYRAALGLWRGPALAGVSGQSVEDEARRLEELRLNAFEDCIAVRLELGHHRELVPELSTVVREQPLRERARRQLMLAQYRSGRRAEAMESFRDARRQFIDELGLEPGPDMQDLHDAILRDDVALTAAPPLPQPRAGVSEAVEPAPETAFEPRQVPSELPADVPGFTGRLTELDSLAALVGGGADARTPTVGLVTGVAGVGKTGLAVHWAHGAAADFPDGRLFADLRGYDEHHEPTAVGEVLSRFLRALGVPSQQIPAEVEARSSLFRSVLDGRRVLVVLDNARTTEQIQPLLPSSGGCSVLVTSREQLEELVTWPPQARVHLGLLPPDDATDLLGRIVGAERIAAGEEVARLVELCDRLPLALRIAGARLASKPHWTVRHLVRRLSDERSRLDELSQGPSQVRISFALSYRYLPADAAMLYRRLGLLEVPDFTAWTGAALLDVEILAAERLIEHLVDAQFLEVVGPDATGQLRYRLQNLLRLFARERVQAEESEPERWAACERVFQTCLALAEHAHRRAYGGDYSVLHSAVTRRELDPAYVDELLAVPMDWFEVERLSLLAVVKQTAGMGMDDLAWDLTMSMVALFESRNYLEDWRTCCDLALEVARGTANPRGQAAMLHALGALELRLRRLQAAREHFTAALRLHRDAGEEHGRALTLRNMAIVDRMQGDLEAAMDRVEEALGTFRATGDLSSEAHALNNMAAIELDRGRPAASIALSREALRVAETIGEGGSRAVAQATHRLARALLSDGQLTAAEQAFVRVVAVVRERSDMVGLSYALLGLGETWQRAEQWDKAELALVDALEYADRSNSPLVEGQIRLALSEVGRHRGKPEQAREQLAEARLLFERVGSPPWQRRADEALEQLELAEPAREPHRVDERRAGRQGLEGPPGTEASGAGAQEQEPTGPPGAEPTEPGGSGVRRAQFRQDGPGGA